MLFFQGLHWVRFLHYFDDFNSAGLVGCWFSWSVNSLIVAGSGTEQWNATTGTSGTVDSSTTVSPLYYHQYEVTFAVSGNGSTSPLGSNVWENAGSLSITATPNAGYAFSSWSSNTGSITFNNATSASATATISGTGTITATFAIKTYTITVTQGANGVIAPGASTVNYGGSQNFTITPNTGYSIASLTVDGSPVAVASSYIFSNVTGTHTITATFALTPTSTPQPTAAPTSAPTPMPTMTPNPTPTPTLTTSVTVAQPQSKHPHWHRWVNIFQ